MRAFNARFCLTTNLKITLTYLRAFNARFCFIPCWRATSHAAHRQETLKQRILNPSPSIQPGCPLSHIFSWYCHPRSFPFIFNVLPHISVILNLSKVISKEIYHFFLQHLSAINSKCNHHRWNPTVDFVWLLAIYQNNK